MNYSTDGSSPSIEFIDNGSGQFTALLRDLNEDFVTNGHFKHAFFYMAMARPTFMDRMKVRFLL